MSANGGFTVSNIFSCEMHFFERCLVVLQKSLISSSDKKCVVVRNVLQLILIDIKDWIYSCQIMSNSFFPKVVP